MGLFYVMLFKGILKDPAMRREKDTRTQRDRERPMSNLSGPMASFVLPNVTHLFRLFFTAHIHQQKYSVIVNRWTEYSYGHVHVHVHGQCHCIQSV